MERGTGIFGRLKNCPRVAGPRRDRVRRKRRQVHSG
jgi:hypothetical protein